jgi:hypothetical protein
MPRGIQSSDSFQRAVVDLPGHEIAEHIDVADKADYYTFNDGVLQRPAE